MPKSIDTRVTQKIGARNREGGTATRRRRTYTVTGDTLKKIAWVKEMLRSGDVSELTIRGLADEVKDRFGTSMNTNLLADLLHAAREGELEEVDIRLTASKRGRPTTLSPDALAQRKRDQQIKKIAETIAARPALLVCAQQNDEIEIEGFPNREEADRRVCQLLGEGVRPTDICCYDLSEGPHLVQ